MASGHAEYVKLRSDKEDLIDEFMDSQKFKDLIEIHDEGLYPAQFTAGGDQAVGAILKEYPGLFDAKNFISLEQPVV